MSHTFAPSRRQLVLGAAVAAAILPGSSTIASAMGTKPLALHDLDDWKAQLGGEFAVRTDTGVAPMALVAVKGGQRQPAHLARRNNFTAVFEMDAGAAPKSGIYAVGHAEHGQTPLYLESTTVKGGKATLRASFN